jgi:hypothetical protein
MLVEEGDGDLFFEMFFATTRLRSATVGQREHHFFVNT